MRGKERQIAGYLAQRGWRSAAVQRVVREWEPVLGNEAVKEAFLVLRRVYEDGAGTVLEVHGPQHLKFLREMASALERLHDRKSCAGWVIKMCGRFNPGVPKGRRRLLSFEQMAKAIQAQGGPNFSVDALKKTAQRLELCDSDEEAERGFH